MLPIQKLQILPPDTAAGWNEIKSGLQATVGSINHRYAKSTIPDVVKENSWEGSAWRGERISAQLILWSNEAVRQIKCEFSDFKR